MSEVANRRKCIEAVRVLVASTRPTVEDIALAITSLAQVITDYSDVKCTLQLHFDDPEAAQPKAKK